MVRDESAVRGCLYSLHQFFIISASICLIGSMYLSNDMSEVVKNITRVREIRTRRMNQTQMLLIGEYFERREI